MNKKIGIIGTGHIGTALFRGLIGSGKIDAAKFMLSNPNLGKLNKLQKEFGIKITTGNSDIAKTCNVVIIAVRPEVVTTVITEIRKFIEPHQIIISVAACIPISLLEKHFGKSTRKIIRIMPNIPVAYGKGVVGWIGNRNINLKDKLFTKNLLSPLGLLIECKTDEQLEKVSVIAGCATGYITYFLKNMEEKALKYGFSKEKARQIVLSALAGTAHHLTYSNISFDEVIASIATPGGITEEILRSLDEQKYPEIFGKSLDSGYAKIKKITKELKNGNN